MDYWGMWSMEHYLSLLLGEVERLRDDANGYGPNGADYIAHVDIPAKVEIAAQFLRENGLGTVRTANPLYGDKTSKIVQIA